MTVINMEGRLLRVSDCFDASYYDAMDPFVSIATRRMKEAQILARRSYYVDEHKHRVDTDRQLIRRYNANKIFRDPKKNYNRQKKLYKKGMRPQGF